jgi:hypothetical protein
MSKQLPADGEHVERVEIVYGLPPSTRGTYLDWIGDGNRIVCGVCHPRAVREAAS